MKRSTLIVAAALFLASLAVRPAAAQNVAIGCGGGNGATIACNANGNSGTVTLSNFSSASSTGIAFQITSTSGLPSGIEDLTPLGEAMSLSFTNVGFNFGSTPDFTITDGDGDFTLTGEAEFDSTPTLTGTLMLLLQPTFVSIGGADDGGQLFSGAISGVTGGAECHAGSGQCDFDDREFRPSEHRRKWRRLDGGSNAGARDAASARLRPARACSIRADKIWKLNTRS